MKLTYIGPKKEHTFSFPIPYLTKGDFDGEVRFQRDKAIEVKDEWATRLMEFCPHFFKEFQPQAQKG